MTQQFESVNCKYGAPMGRSESGYLEKDVRRFVRLFQVRLDNGGYDDGGAYWGIGSPLWCAIDDDGNRQFTRAATRRQAALVLGIPSLALKVGIPNAQRYGADVLAGHAPLPQGVTREDVIEWLKRCGAAMGQAEDMRPKTRTGL